MKEVYNFMQDDLNNNDVMVLDCYSTLYMWMGKKANKPERTKAIKKVEAYVQGIADERDKKNVQYVEIDPCSEPFQFTTHFPEWEEEVSQKWLEMDPYQAELARIEAEKQAAFDAKWKKEEVKYEETGATFSYEELKTIAKEEVPLKLENTEMFDSINPEEANQTA